MNKLFVSPGCKRVRVGKALGDKFDVRSFHGATLSTGPLPVLGARQ
ncbi:MAG TPA: hypothetical protein VJ833_05110 [Rhodanobacteraceae bacterium]|nr:hypothetical protein [Rhodanobacteraceae bacterium]